VVIAFITARRRREESGRLLVWRQGALLLRSRLLRWRLETYGLYMPSLPHSRPWWRVNGRALARLIRHHRAYGGWLREMSAVRVSGGPGWWRSRLAGKAAAWEAYLRAVNGSEAGE
jgi:hypothetical protein